MLHISLREDLDHLYADLVVSRPESEITAIYRELADIALRHSFTGRVK